ncbi:MAG: ExeM/NucH family extracellular endonuclease [Blastocatellia bacterium]|nr:ExeM/NucH family extracellular endonuclease [Blastocatellia bacterium]
MYSTLNDLKVALPRGLRTKSIVVAVAFLFAAGLAAFSLSVGKTEAAATELFFSEYIEGSSNNKALEIYNGTGAAVNLATGSYQIEMYFNGSMTAGLTIPLTGTVAAGDVYVVAQGSANATIQAQADQTNSSGWFNGDDAVVLRKGGAGGTIVDVIGQIGTDPGSEWGTGVLSTADNTIRRLASVCQGDAVGSNAFDPSTEWEGFANDTFGGLGSHTANCAGGNAPVTPTCPVGISVSQGTATTINVSATDADGTVTGAMLSSVTPMDAGITLTNFVPAAAVGGAATATINVADTVAANVYTVVVAWSNNDSTAQTATCSVMVSVISTTPTLISAIQGTGETPNFSGQVRTIRGIVTGDFQGASNLNGFFVEEEIADRDADPNTSEGIFVFGGSTDVNVGDNVTVTGTVINFNSPTAGLTELTSVLGITINSTGNALPPAQTVTLPVATSVAADLEKYEGMRVTFGTLFVTANEDLGQFGELGVAATRLFNPTNSIDPNDSPASGNTISGSSNVAAVTAQQSLNNRSRLILDDGKTGSNPNPIPFIGAGTNATVRLGDSISNLTGNLSFGFGSYRVEPTAPVAITAANPRPAAPEAVGGSLKVASFNLENFFFTLADRGATTAAERDRQRDKLAAVIAGLNADVVGLIELEKGTAATPDAAVNELLAKLNTLGVGTYAAVPTPAAVYDSTNPVGTDVDIKSGMIYRTSAVTPVGSSLTDTAAAPGAYSRAPIAQLFRSNANGARFSVVVNHLRSKICSSGSAPEDTDLGDGQSCFNGRRRSQAQALVNFINSVLAPLDPDVMAIGDFNAYTQEDPIDVLRAAGLTDLLTAAPGSYTLTFEGQGGRIDHAFATPSLVSQITGGTIWHINTDEPGVFDYNTEFKTDDRYAATPFRSADHDPLLVGLSLACPEVTVSPETLPNVTAGTIYDQTLTAAGGAGSYTFSITGGALPDGLTIGAGGALSGIPTKTGTFNFTVTATAGGGCGGSRDYSIRVDCPTVSVLPETVANGVRGLPYSQAFTSTGGLGGVTLSLTGSRPTGVSFNAQTGVLAGTPTQAGSYNFTVTATDSNGCASSRNYTLIVFATSVKITDPAVCTGPGGLVAVEATIANPSQSLQQGDVTATLPAGLIALPGSCTATTGACAVVDGGTVNWAGPLNAGQTATIRYTAQIADGVATGTTLCLVSKATIGGATASVQACTTINCAPVGPGLPLPGGGPVSDQRAGSVLIFNIYTSSADTSRQNTRINLTNTDPTRTANVHLFFVDGGTCSVADSYLCLTPSQTTSFVASDFDPGTTGFLIAVAVDANGCPINFNHLIGDEYVKFSSGHAANLGAQAIRALAGGLPACDINTVTATLAFDNVSYSGLPHVLAADNIPSRGDGNDTMLILNRIGGNLATGAATLGNVFGLLYDDSESVFSFNLSAGVCQFRSSVTNTTPRTTPRFETLVPAGRSGWMKLWAANGGAMTGALLNFNPNAAANTAAFNQGHNLHVLTTTNAMSFSMPVFPPSCL